MYKKSTLHYIGRFFETLILSRARRKAGRVSGIVNKSSAPLTPEKKRQLDDLCRKLFERRDLIVSGRLQLLGLDAIKRRMGRRWAGFQDIVYGVCESAIKDYIDRGDIFIRYQDDSYILLYAESDTGLCDLKTAKIADEIRRRLFEQHGIDSVRVHNTTSMLSVQDISNVVRFPESEAEKKASAQKDGAVPAVDMSQLKKVEIDAFAQRKREKKMLDLGIDPDTVPFCAVRYAPVWDLQKGRLSCVVCLADCHAPDMGDMAAHRALYKELSVTDMASVDMAILSSVIDVTRDFPARMPGFGVICPVHYATIASVEGKTRYRSLCQRIDESVKPYILFMVLDTPPKMPWISLGQVVSPLKTYGRVLCGHLPLGDGEIDFPGLRQAGFDNVGIIVDTEKSPRSRNGIYVEISGFVGKARKNLISQTFVLDADAPEIVSAAMAAGVRYVAGAAVHSCVPNLDGPIVFDRNSVLRSGGQSQKLTERSL